jgi:hypothetical protein
MVPQVRSILATAVVAAAVLLAAPTSAQAANGKATDSSTSCSSGRPVSQQYVFDQSTTEFDGGYSVAANCDVTNDVPRVVATVTPATASAMAAATCSTSYRVIHGAQSLQDIINLDIGSIRYGHESQLSGCLTRFTASRWKATGSGSLGWNHLTASSFGSYTSSLATVATGTASVGVHSDFLWCNLQVGQNFTMTTKLTSYQGGAWGATFTQSRTCSGTHMSTASHVDNVYAAW